MKKEAEAQKEFAFSKENYSIIVAGMIFIAIGFILMAGGGSDDPNVFNEEIFSTRRITVAPLVVLAGFALEIIGIMYRSKS